MIVETMTNPGTYSAYVETDGWPFVCFVLSIPLLALLGLATLILIARSSRRQIIVGVVVAVITVAGLSGTGGVMLSASSDYSASDAIKHAQYVHQVQEWLAAQHVVATDAQVRDMIGGATAEVLDSGQIVAGRITGSQRLIHFTIATSSG